MQRCHRCILELEPIGLGTEDKGKYSLKNSRKANNVYRNREKEIYVQRNIEKSKFSQRNKEKRPKLEGGLTNRKKKKNPNTVEGTCTIHEREETKYLFI